MKSTLFTVSSLTLLAGVLALNGCATDAVRFPPSAGHISEPPKTESASNIPAPVQVPLELPPPKVQAKPLTYNVVVTEVPVKELLFSLARDTKLNIDVHPNIQGVVTLNAINEPLTAILDRIANQVNIRYKLEGDTLIVTPDTPYLKSYQVNYVNLSRKTSSSISVATQVATTGSTTTGSAAAGGGAAGDNSSSTTVTGSSSNDFWEVLTANIRDILKSTRSAVQSAEDKNARVEAARASREERLQQANAVARAGQAAPQLFNAAFGQGAQNALEEKKDDVIVNPVSGTVLVMGTAAQHKLVSQYIDGVTAAAARQVLIEATIVEVTLKDQFRAGIDWSRVAALGAGTGFNFRSATNLAGSLTGFQTLTYQNANSNFSAAINLLDSFGDARVLSSPKLLVLNNQTSILKVVNNLVYFTINVQQGTLSSSGSVLTSPTYTSTVNTVPVGVVMSVTPQVNQNGRVTLVVRPTISRQNGVVPDPNPALGAIQNNVPVIQVREMESVLQVTSGETAILGGLMQDDVSKNRDGLPGLTDNPVTNILTGTRDRNATQTELVIFLRPTVITNPSLSSDELSFYKRFLPQSPATK